MIGKHMFGEETGCSIGCYCELNFKILLHISLESAEGYLLNRRLLSENMPGFRNCRWLEGSLICPSLGSSLLTIRRYDVPLWLGGLPLRYHLIFQWHRQLQSGSDLPGVPFVRAAF